MIRNLNKVCDFELINLKDMPLARGHFLESTHPNIAGASLTGNMLDYRLREIGILPFEEMRYMDYDRLNNLRGLIGATAYNKMMDRLFELSIEVIKHEEKIKIGFVVYDSAVWCGDRLYNHFAQNDRYEATLFLCLRMDEKSSLIADIS